MGAVLQICVTCRGNPPATGKTPPGRRLAQAVLACAGTDIRLVPVKCFHACAHGCNAALTGADGWTRIAGGLCPSDAAALARWAEGGEMPGRLIASIPPFNLKDPA